ncbi:probable serine/threonine-protein kinase PBL28 [Rutidosis leptorrhynchoides]|uniref:probable serine/threonine-protein kinase PBL28 n=1 Tax=Rutidosis leptorrhynchoides TaxID=125765 RepID=UPI003A9920F2
MKNLVRDFEYDKCKSTLSMSSLTKKIPLEEILEATNNFAKKNIIGKGGFGNVYKGKITRSGKSIKIAARRLGRNQWQGDVEFWTEIFMLSTLSYPNIVELIGYCDEKDEKFIIYRACSNGSLVRYLSDPTTLSWFHRLYLSFYLADAIVYIHGDLGAGYYIIHGNINSSTIILDCHLYHPRLSGFEHSIKRSVDRKDQVYIGDVIGTHGYMDPAIETSKGVTHKTDIYSLGVVLFELLCGRKAFEDNKLLAPLAKKHYENGTLREIIHPDLWNQMDPESFKLFSKAAYSCLHEDPTQRPDASQICDKLLKAKIIHEKLVDYKEDMDYVDAIQNLFMADKEVKKSGFAVSGNGGTTMSSMHNMTDEAFLAFDSMMTSMVVSRLRSISLILVISRVRLL